MATLALTAVGAFVGGPFGAAIGAIAGQQVDSSLFAPKARQGPRLGGLTVQTSSYGTAIPKIFGTMRVAGTVIWATDLKERKSRSGGGKGRPKTVNYSYSASFAVALSGRPIRAVRRIWADGKLLRGAAGDFKSETGYRLYLGTESQPVDPLIASTEGAGRAPAHRGIAYAVFEDFELADYGNRIPSLSFEVEAGTEPVTIGSIAEALSAGDLKAGETPELTGYAASGDSVRGAIAALADVAALSLEQREERLVLTSVSGDAQLVRGAEAGARSRAGAGGRSEVSRKAAAAIAAEVSIAYHDPARDYQSGLQRAKRGGGLATDRTALPAVLRAESAKSLAEHRLACLWAARETGKQHLSWRRGLVSPGSMLRLEGQSGLWKVGRTTFDRMVLSLELVRVPGNSVATAPGASAGRLLSEPDGPHGPTTLFLFEVPTLGEDLALRPQLLTVAAGTQSGWRRAALLASYDGGGTWEPQGSTAVPAVMGRAATALGPGGSALIDNRSSVEIELLNENMWMEGRSDGALAAGANIAALGEEIIQFGRAEPIGKQRFRLSRLLRGRRGTEWAAPHHGVGEPFALIEAEAFAPIEPPPGITGAEIRLLAQGIGDSADSLPVRRTVEGRALQPPSPVHLGAARTVDGGISIRWVRRSRNGWNWGSEAETPLGEEKESYRLVLGGAGFERALQVGQARYIYTADQQAADGLNGTLRIEVAQIGTHASSRPAVLFFDQQ